MSETQDPMVTVTKPLSEWNNILACMAQANPLLASLQQQVVQGMQRQHSNVVAMEGGRDGGSQRESAPTSAAE